MTFAGFFGLRADIEAAPPSRRDDRQHRAHRAWSLQTSVAYQAFRHQERHVANASFTLGMLASIADKLAAMKAARARAPPGGRAIVVAKQAVVDAEIEKLGLEPERCRTPAAWCRRSRIRPARLQGNLGDRRASLIGERKGA